MGAGSSTTRWEDEVARWTKVGALGMQEALRRVDCSEEKISVALQQTDQEYFRSDELGGELHYKFTEKERSTIFATVGRGISRVVSVHIYPVTEKEAFVFCVNLMSNTNVQTITGAQAFRGRRCIFLENALLTNPAIKTLKFRHGSVDSDDVIFLMKGCRPSKTLEHLDFSENPLGNEGVTLIAEKFLDNSLTVNSNLRTLELNDVGVGMEGVRSLVKSGQLSKTLEELDLSWNPLGDEGVSVVADFLANNTSLKRLKLQSVGCCLEGAKHLSSALACNISLEELWFGMFYQAVEIVNSSYGEYQRIAYSYLKENPTFGADLVEGYRVVLESFSLDGEDAPLSQTVPKNCSLRKLRLQLRDILQHENPTYLESLTSILKRNQTLYELSLGLFKLPPEVWREHFFLALKENATLKALDISYCEGLSEDVFQALMDVLQNSNSALEEVKVLGTPLGTRLAEKWSQVEEELRINKDYRSALRGQPLVSVTSGRLVLCGFAFGGKTELSKTMLRIDKGAPTPNPLKMRWKKLKQRVPLLQRLLFGKDVYRELASRTRGCHISGLENQLPLKSIWDFAGQKEYYALHDYLFPNMNNSCFLFVCSSRGPPLPNNLIGFTKDKKTMKEECTYWMKFIASNFKVRIRKDGQGLQLPCVVFVLTKKDTLQRTELGIAKADARSVVQELKREFEGVVDLCESVQVVDARSAEDVIGLLTVVKRVLGSTLENQKEFAVCQEVREILGRWSAENQSQPVLKLDKYYELCQAQIKSHNQLIPVNEDQQSSRLGRDAILAYLNDLGEIISLKGLDFIVTNTRWFGEGVLGSLINAFKGTDDRTGLLKSCLPPLRKRWDPPKDGFVERENMEVLLKHSLETMDLEERLTTDQLTDLMIKLEMCYKKDPKVANSSLFMPALFDDATDSAAQGQRQLNWKLNETGSFIYLGRRLSCKEKSKTFLSPGFFPRWQVHMLNLLQGRGWASNPAFQIGRNVIGFSHNAIEVLIEYSGDIDYFVDILVRSSKPYAEVLNFIEIYVLHNIRQFCASPQGCQGAVLETSVIRPVCVQNLDKCVDRNDQSVLISLLEDNLASDPGYKHTWKVPRRQESDTSYALDLLQGKGSFMNKHKSLADQKPDIASSWASSSSGRDDLPKLIYPTIDDVGMFRNFVTSLNLRKKIALKLHLLCENKDGSHVVEKQPGRTYILNWKDGVDIPIAKHLVTLLYSAVGVGATISGAHLPLPSTENLLKLLDAPEIPIVELETLQQRMNPGQAPGQVSNEDICALLTRYMEKDPRALGMKEFLKLEDSRRFWEDFQMQKVLYKNAPFENKIGWVCDRCYWEGLNDGILETY